MNIKVIFGTWLAFIVAGFVFQQFVTGGALAAVFQATAGLMALEGKGETVYFNPKELTIDKSVPWQKHKNVEGDEPTLEFTAAEPETMEIELMFDTYEERTDVYERYVAPLEVFTMVDEDLGRPPMTMLTWGRGKQFQGVVEDINTHYTMFLEDGTPVRATVSLKLKQTSKATRKSKGK